MKDSQAAGRRRASGAESLSHGLYFDLPVEPVGVTKLKDTGVRVAGEYSIVKSVHRNIVSSQGLY